MSFESLDEVGKGGVALGLAGGLIAFVPTFERLLYTPPGWMMALFLTLVAAAVVGGAVLAIMEHQALGGAIAAVAGAMLVFFGPTTGGALALVGGSLLFLNAGQDPSETFGSGDRGGSAKP